MKKIIYILLLVVLASCAGVPAPEPYGPCPTPQQVEWQRMEVNMFCHFGPNTFTGAEWGSGEEAESLFNPTALDCRQWVSVARQAGMGGIILTAKHHDGFCLWPNPQSTHTVRESAWRNGRGDVVAELADACREAGLKMGVYVSPWDRHDPAYGTAAYNDKFRLTLEDIHSRYGDIFEQWFDGANGEGPTGKRQQYDWPLFNSTVLRLHPRAIIFSDVGPGCRWVGNESGAAGETCWSLLDIEGFAPGAESPSQDTLNSGNRHGACWVPAETDVSIRPGWFWHADEHPKKLQELLDIYYTSVGRNSLLLLNVPPDSRGLIPAEDSLRLMEFRQALEQIFATDYAQGATAKADEVRGGRHCKTYAAANLLDTNYNTYWATDDGVNTASVTLTFPKAVTFNRVLLQEYIPLGQRVSKFHIDYQDTDGNWHSLAEGTTIGYKRILRTPIVAAQAVRLTIDSADACPLLNRLSLHLDPYE